MSYKQNNPLSRKNSKWGGNKDDYKRRDIGGVEKKIGDVDGHYKDYEGMSRKSSSPLNEQKWGGNKHDYKRHDVGGVMKKTGVVDHHYKDYEGMSRKSSSPLNQDELNKDERSGRLRPDYSDYEEQQKRHGITTSTEPYVPPVDYISQEDWDNATDEQKGISRKSSPLNNTGITGLNYSDELRYMPIVDDMHRRDESPANFMGIKRPGRCTPFPNPDCRPGTPQYNLAKRLKPGGDLYKGKKKK